MVIRLMENAEETVKELFYVHENHEKTRKCKTRLNISY